MAFASQNHNSGTVQLAVKGWAMPPSKFASDPVAGEEAVVSWLEKRSQRKILNYKTIGKTHVLLIDVNSQDASRFHHLNGFTFSGAVVAVEDAKPRSQPHSQVNGNQFPPSGPRNDNRLDNRITNNAPSGPRGLSLLDRVEQTPSSHQRHNARGGGSGFNSRNNQTNSMSGIEDQTTVSKQTAEQLLAAAVHARYNANDKFLTFENLAMDLSNQSPDFQSAAPHKVFNAIFAICQSHVFETPAKRKEMVHSVSLANNNLSNVRDVIALSATFPSLKNLDLSNNNIKDLGDMKFWRNAFRDLEHLILTGNPIDQNTHAKESLVRWYRHLKMMNGQPISRGSGGQNDTLQPGNNNQPPQRTDSPAPFSITSGQRPTLGHPEFPPESTFGMPQPGKSDDTLLKEQQGLKFSFDTGLKMSFVEQALVANNFDYDQAMRNFQELRAGGGLPIDAFVVPMDQIG